MNAQSRIVLAVHRVLLRTSGTPLGRMWRFAYRVAARAWVAYLARGEQGAAAYVRGGAEVPDLLPGISDVDVAVVLPTDPAGPGIASERARQRWERLRRTFPATRLLLDYPRIYDDEELRDVTDSSAFTYGLDGPGEGVPRQATYLGAGASPDKTRILERPGLYGTTADWRLLAGRDRRPFELPRDPQLRRIAAWLELLYWWRWVFPVCVDPSGPRTASLCLKLVAEPARVWLWMAHGERVPERADALRRALQAMPEEEDALRQALELQRSLPESPDPPLAEVLPVLVRLSTRIAGLIAAEIEGEGTTEVRLGDAAPAELIFADGRWAPVADLEGGQEPQVLPLSDWCALAWPRPPDEALALLPGDPGNPAVLGAAASSHEAGPYPAFSAGGLLILPSITRWRTRLRAIQCPATDPVSFALLEGSRVARFPNVRGWSAADTARRAAAEHLAWLRSEREPWEGNGSPSGRARSLGMLLTAARAGLFLESVEVGDPELPLTVTETLRRVAAGSSGDRAIAEDALERYREFGIQRTTPPATTVRAFRDVVRKLPAYAEAG